MKLPSFPSHLHFFKASLSPWKQWLLFVSQLHCIHLQRLGLYVKHNFEKGDAVLAFFAIWLELMHLKKLTVNYIWLLTISCESIGFFIINWTTHRSYPNKFQVMSIFWEKSDLSFKAFDDKFVVEKCWMFHHRLVHHSGSIVCKSIKRLTTLL